MGRRKTRTSRKIDKTEADNESRRPSEAHPPANPPRPNAPLLIASIVLFAIWFVALLIFALSERFHWFG